MSASNHDGGCHCGAVRSMCGRAGSYLQFVTPDKFTLHKGSDNVTDYQFNKHVIHHLFCKTCGMKSFARGTTRDGREMIAINVRCLDDVDTNELPTKKFDGKKM